MMPRYEHIIRIVTFALRLETRLLLTLYGVLNAGACDTDAQIVTLPFLLLTCLLI